MRATLEAKAAQLLAEAAAAHERSQSLSAMQTALQVSMGSKGVNEESQHGESGV